MGLTKRLHSRRNWREEAKKKIKGKKKGKRDEKLCKNGTSIVDLVETTKVSPGRRLRRPSRLVRLSKKKRRRTRSEKNPHGRTFSKSLGQKGHIKVVSHKL